MSNEEMLAKALAGELRPWLERIKALETENAVQQRRIELLEMTNIDPTAEVKAMGYRDKGASIVEAPAWRAPPKISIRRSIKLGH